MRPLLVLALLVAGAPFAAAQAPEQVHLGLPTSDPSTALSVLWLETGAPRGDAAVVLETPDGPRSFAAEVVPGPSVGVAYEAKLTGLTPGAAYAYAVGARSFAFSTPPADGSFSFVALGDMGVTPQARATVETVQRLRPSFVLHAGDVSYAEGDPTVWAEWFGLVEPFAATAPWITAIGNHEADAKGATLPVADANLVLPTEQAFYRQRFGLPGNELWYSFDWQGAHFVALDTFSEVGIPVGEVEWLEADLVASADAAWTIVFLHEPPFSSNSHGSSARVQEAFVPLFEKHGVDLVLAAHDHGYERFEPRDGPFYIVSGGAGESLYRGWREPLEEGSAAHSSTYHVTLVTVSPDRLEVAYVPTGESGFSDAFVLTKVASPAPGEVSGAASGNAVPAMGIAAAAGALVAVALLRRR